MKPNFALNLSHEGISLLHRAKTGWLRVGGVALDADDLEAQLQLLRRTAAEMENGGLTTKLVIPNSQILYTEVEAPGRDTAARIAQIRDGLVGLTPYDVSDLVFDWRIEGTRAQVAVVARDTLREAESFASEYRFNPVSFVAVPVNGAFDGEPYFGPTRLAASLLIDGEVIEPDTAQIRVLGTVKAAAEKPDPKPDPKSDTKPAPQDDPTPALVVEPVVVEPANADPGAHPDTVAAAIDVDVGLAPRERPASDDKPDPDLTAPAVAFASRRATMTLPPADAAIDKARVEPRLNLGSGAPVTGQNANRVTSVTASTLVLEGHDIANGVAQAKAQNTPGFEFKGQRRGAAAAPLYPSPKPGKATAAAPKAPTAPRFIPSVAKAPVDHANGPDRTPMPMTAPHTADVVDPKEKAAERRRLARQKAQKATSALVGTFSKLSRSTVDGARSMRAKPKAARASATEAQAMTVFGARGQSFQRGKPRYLGLTLTLVLLLALAVLALWSTYFMNDIASGFFNTVDEEPEIAAPAVIPQPAPLDLGVLAATPVSPTETAAIPAPAPEAPQTPIEAAVAAALSDPETLVPRAPETVAPAPDPSPELALLAQPEVPEPELQPEPEPTFVPDPIITIPEHQPPPTPAQAQARYAATGIWQLDPDPLGDVPGGGDQLEDIYIASIDPVISSTDAVALPNAEVLATDQRPSALTPPTPLGTDFDFDERGLVRATPDGATSPDGVPVFSGPPPVVPGPRPADLEVPVDETRLILNERLQAMRPGVRPGTLADSNERARLGGFSSTELAAIRPGIRPISLQQQRGSVFDTAAPETETAAIDPVFIGEDATELAVVASRAPPGRPTNFSGVVERALAEAIQAPPDPLPEADAEPEVLASAAVAAPRMPPLPSRASVAKQATVRGAINLGRVNLIGIYGAPSQRRALVRLASGKYVKVEVGDRVDGGQVAAIGESELRYVKSGRNITLKMPKG